MRADHTYTSDWPFSIDTLEPGAFGFYSWLSGFPAISRERLKRINLASSSSKHIILTLSYGVIDSNIKAINRMVTNFLLLRLRLERQSDHRRVEKLENKLKELHSAIDAITGVKRPKKNADQLCKSAFNGMGKSRDNFQFSKLG